MSKLLHQEIRTEDDILRIFDRAMSLVRILGIQPGNITEVKVNRKLRTHLGNTYKKDDKFKIEYHKMFLWRRDIETECEGLLIHEILHTCPDSMGHDGEWAKNAAIVAKAYPQFENHMHEYFEVSKSYVQYLR